MRDKIPSSHWSPKARVVNASRTPTRPGCRTRVHFSTAAIAASCCNRKPEYFAGVRDQRCASLAISTGTFGLTFDPSQDIASPFSLLPGFVQPASVASPADSTRPRTRSALTGRLVERHETRIASDFLRQFEIDHRRRLSRFRLLGERDVQCGREEEGCRRRVGACAGRQRRREMPRVGRRQRVVEVILQLHGRESRFSLLMRSEREEEKRYVPVGAQSDPRRTGGLPACRCCSTRLRQPPPLLQMHGSLAEPAFRLPVQVVRARG